jgi:hypothetical protein
VKRNIVWIVAIVAVAVIAFVSGMKLAPTLSGTSGTSGGPGRFAAGGGGFPGGGNFRGGTGGAAGGQGQGRFGGGFVSGKVISKDAKSITVKLVDGGSRTIYVSGTTTYSKTSEVTGAEVSVGTTITASGTSAPDGSVTARSVIIGGLPMFGRGGGPDRQAPQGQRPQGQSGQTAPGQ